MACASADVRGHRRRPAGVTGRACSPREPGIDPTGPSGTSSRVPTCLQTRLPACAIDCGLQGIAFIAPSGAESGLSLCRVLSRDGNTRPVGSVLPQVCTPLVVGYRPLVTLRLRCWVSATYNTVRWDARCRDKLRGASVLSMSHVSHVSHGETQGVR